MGDKLGGKTHFEDELSQFAYHLPQCRNNERPSCRQVIRFEL